jgi:hypothetical protein
MATPNPDDVAKAFTNHYYNMFDTNPDGLAGLFVSLRCHERSIGGCPSNDMESNQSRCSDRLLLSSN